MTAKVFAVLNVTVTGILLSVPVVSQINMRFSVQLMYLVLVYLNIAWILLIVSQHKSTSSMNIGDEKGFIVILSQTMVHFHFNMHFHLMPVIFRSANYFIHNPQQFLE